MQGTTDCSNSLPELEAAWGIAWENVVGVENIFSVDIDPSPSQLSAQRRKTSVAHIDQLLQENGPNEVDVLIGDVADPRWWHTTVVQEPFEWLSWSSPCVSFAKTGWMAGLLSPEGITLLRAIGLFVVFGREISLGENVLSLLSHSHWKVIEEFAKTFGTWTAVDINLVRIAPMQRPRLFMTQTKYVDVEKKTIDEWIHIALQDVSVAPHFIMLRMQLGVFGWTT